MALIFNNVSVPANGAVVYNNISLSTLKHNNVEVWKREKKIYPGIGIAKAINNGNWHDYWSYSDNGSTIEVNSYGGTHIGSGLLMVGPFSSIGYSQAYFSNCVITPSVSAGLNVKIGVGDINGNFVHIFFEDANWGYPSATLTASNVYSISENGNFFLIIYTAALDNYSGHQMNVKITGFYLK